MDRQILRVDRRVLRMERQVLRVGKRVLRVGEEYDEWGNSTTTDQASNTIT